MNKQHNYAYLFGCFKWHYAVFLNIIFISFFKEVNGQTSPIKGKLLDTVFNRNCAMAAVIIFDEDSSVFQFTRASRDGSFYFANVPVGHYHILIEHPFYSDRFENCSVSVNEINDLGILALFPKADTLASVVVTAQSIPRLKGDTLEYNTSNIKLEVNTNVEELLRQLPGIAVDQQGNITINGQKVEGILIDGEDIFSRSPTIITRNLNGEMVKKIQLFEKKSKKAAFTGIDDGERTTTINLVLKDDHKFGYFGKIEGGYDPGKYYFGDAFVGSFIGKRQIVALGMITNTGSEGPENDGIDPEIQSEGIQYTDPMGSSAGKGIPSIVSAAGHYADKWKNNTEHFAGNYQSERITSNPISSILSQQILPDSLYTQKQQCTSTNTESRNEMSGDYDFSIDSLSAIQCHINGSNLKGENEFVEEGSSFFNDTLVNNNYRTIQSQVQGSSVGTSFLVRKQSKKVTDRMFSLNSGFSQKNYTTNGFLYSINNFYQGNSALLLNDTIDQRKVIVNSGFDLNVGANLTEPLWKKNILAISGQFSWNRSNSLLQTFGKVDGKYQTFIDSLSSHYRNDVITGMFTINLQGENAHFSYTIGGDIGQSSINEVNLMKDSVLNYKYVQLMPRISFRYHLGTFKEIVFFYNGTTLQPSVQQLQTVQNNSDPLNITIGNPNLHAGFNHVLRTGFQMFRPIVMTMGVMLNSNMNLISTRTFTDSLGRQVNQLMNVNGNYILSGYFCLSKTFSANHLTLAMNSNYSCNKSINYVNNLINKNKLFIEGVSFIANKYVSDKYRFNLISSFIYSSSTSSINQSAVTNYWTQTHSALFSFYPIRKLEVNTSCLFTWRQNTSLFNSNSQTFVLNAFVSKLLLDNSLSIRFQVNDIFGQNNGISRVISSNVVSQNISNVIGRYWMVVATWHFGNSGNRDIK